MNIDASRVATEDSFSLKSGDTSGLCGTNDVWTKPWKSDTEGLARRQIAMLDAVARANTLGRFPANVIVRVAVQSAFPEVVGATSRSDTASIRQIVGQPGEQAGTIYQDSTLSASRFFKNLVK